MTRKIALMAVFISACVDSPTQAPPVVWQPPETPPSIASIRDISIGDRVEGIFGDGQSLTPGEHHFYATAPSDGTLELSLAWSTAENGTLLVLKVDGVKYAGTRPNWSPIVVRRSVKAGQRYLIVVALGGTDWIAQDPFVLTSRLDQ